MPDNTSPCRIRRGLGDASERGRRRLVNRPDVNRAASPLPRTLEIAGEQPLVASYHRQPRMHGRVAVSLQQPLGARCPSSYRREQGGVEQEMKRDPRGGARRREMVSTSHRVGMKTLPGVDRHLDVAGGIGGGREQFEVRSAQAGRGVSPCEQVVGPAPIAAAGGISSAIEGHRVVRLGHMVTAVNRRAILPGCSHRNTCCYAFEIETARKNTGGRGMQRALVNGIELEYDVTGGGEPVLMISPVLADGFQPLVRERALADRYQLITITGGAGSAARARRRRSRLPIMRPMRPRCSIICAWPRACRRPFERRRGRRATGARRSAACAEPGTAGIVAALGASRGGIPRESWTGVHGIRRGPAGSRAGDVHERGRAGFTWDACRALLDERIPGAVAQTIADADTFFGVELPALSAWTFGAEQAARVSQPVLSVVGGETQPLWVEVADRLRSWFGQVEECTIEGAGHLLHIQRSAPVAACLAAFFGRHALAAQSTSRVAAEAQA